MKTTPRGLPLFRSEGQAKVLTEIFLAADGMTLSEIARRQHLSPSTVHHEVQRLERSGIVRSDRIGRNRIVHPDQSSQVFPEISGLILKAFGPLRVLRDVIEDVPNIAEAHIYGSWARRYRGELGRVPSDIDVIVIGSPDPDDVYAACRRAERRLRMDVNPVIVSSRDWKAGSTSFLKQVRKDELVSLKEKSDANR